ncbi:hypothetical protein V8G54_002622 [Vigna mungo]|uniref:Uncharacterized protein n=1 Tax=Vigna mungo TaxID=3915 RepID=A0AAQ3SC24_VIGMU
MIKCSKNSSRRRWRSFFEEVLKEKNSIVVVVLLGLQGVTRGVLYTLKIERGYLAANLCVVVYILVRGLKSYGRILNVGIEAEPYNNRAETGPVLAASSCLPTLFLSLCSLKVENVREHSPFCNSKASNPKKYLQAYGTDELSLHCDAPLIHYGLRKDPKASGLSSTSFIHFTSFGGGGFSPGKLRNMLLGVEKKRKEEEELDSTFTTRSQNSDMDESGTYALGSLS